MATSGQPGLRRVLVRHFVRQFFSLDSIATGGDVKEIVAIVEPQSRPRRRLAARPGAGAPGYSK